MMTDSEPIDPEQAMRAALDEARRAGEHGEVPIGAILIGGGRMVARAHNETIAAHDPTAHAEIVTIRRAATAAGNHRLPGTTLYVTLEPCVMCFGAIVQARIESVVYAADDPKGGGTRLYRDARARGILHGRLEVTSGLLADEAGRLLIDFFRERRA